MTDYRHHWKDGAQVHHPCGKIVCIGRNYADHAAELNNPIPESPLLFIKPSTAAVHMTRPVRIPRDRGEVHFETELAVLIGRPLTAASQDDSRQAILGYGLALDLTLRELQSELKKKGQPWELAKGFDGACPLSPFVPAESLPQRNLKFSLDIDGERRQTGDTSVLLNPILPLISYISHQFTLLPGDVVLTGTPKGVGPLHPDQILSLQLEDALFIETRVV
ncbi:fumarylacetoacetate hydrolase family protein [Marinobacter sp.]|uniref:fumarylacetoacetate hydrolase family protein n=1 Tax=Marinobacter sp. TaxID=50741 RepID=UPI00384DFE6B